MSVQGVDQDPRAARHRTMAEAAVAQLREAIALGELVPGAPLRLEDLARSLGMSISPIREAVRQLESLGLAEHVPHHGARVVALDAAELRDLFEVRLLLERHAVERAAARFGEEDAERAERHLCAYGEARRAGDVRRALHAHTDFHFTLYEASGSVWLVRLIRPAWESCERYRSTLFAQYGKLQDRHQALDLRMLEACRSHDSGGAADALHEHLELFGDFYSRELGGRGIFDP